MHDQREVLAHEQRQPVDREAEQQAQALPLERQRVRPDGSQPGEGRHQEELQRTDPRRRALSQQEQQQQRADDAAELTAFSRGSRHDTRRSFSTSAPIGAGQADARAGTPRRPPRPCRARRGRGDARSRSRAPTAATSATRRQGAPAQEARAASPRPACTAARAPQAKGDSMNTSRSSSAASRRRAAEPPRLSTRIGARLSSTPRPMPAKSTRS